MPIAIRKLETDDISAFNDFLKTERTPLPHLKLSPLVEPHEDIAVVACKKGMRKLNDFAQSHSLVLREYGGSIISLSRHEPLTACDNSR